MASAMAQGADLSSRSRAEYGQGEGSLPDMVAFKKAPNHKERVSQQRVCDRAPRSKFKDLGERRGKWDFSKC